MLDLGRSGVRARLACTAVLLVACTGSEGLPDDPSAAAATATTGGTASTSTSTDLPERRSYHVAYTAGVRDELGDSQRLVGSYELNLLDGAWLIGTAFLDTYDAWLEPYSAPLRQLGCAPAPWR